MQELEKILEEIDNLYVDETDFGIECNMENRSDVACDNCYECIKEACKNIIRKHMNDGWIPVEERLPTMEEYQKDDGRFILDDGNRRCAGYFNVYTGRFYSYRHITQYMAELHENNWVIAWQPLPEAYHPERSEE